MAKPPAQFSPEPGATGAPCGHSWYRSLRVDGAVPGSNYGREYYVNLPPVATRPLPEFGRGSSAEADLIGSIQAQIDAMVSRLHAIKVDRDSGERVFLQPKQEGAIRWLLAAAQSNLDAVEDEYDKWQAFPLSSPDSAAGANPGCAGKQAYSRITTPRGDVYACPGPLTYDQRRASRARIAARVTDAMHHLRCAQYRYHRLRLYDRARELYEPRPGEGFGVASPTETPWVGPQPQVATVIPDLGRYVPGGLGGPRGFADAPPDVPEVDPDALPPPDSAADDESLIARAQRLPGWAKVGATAAVVTLLAVFLTD